MLCEHGGWYGILGIDIFTPATLFLSFYYYNKRESWDFVYSFGGIFLRFLFVDWTQAENTQSIGAIFTSHIFWQSWTGNLGQTVI